MSDGNGITFTTKEMLQSLDTKIDKIDAKLDRKVDVHLFDRLDAAVTGLDVRLAALAAQVALQDKVNDTLRARAKETADKSASNFTRWEKALALGLMALTLVATVYFRSRHP